MDLGYTVKSVSQALGITDTGAVLVRPDGFVAWRSSTDAEASTLIKALQKVLGTGGDPIPDRSRVTRFHH